MLMEEMNLVAAATDAEYVLGVAEGIAVVGLIAFIVLC